MPVNFLTIGQTNKTKPSEGQIIPDSRSDLTFRAPLMSTLSTDGFTPSSLVRCGLDITMTPSVIQSSGGCLRLMLRSARPIPSFPCSSSMSRSCELLLFTIIGPIFRRNIPSLYIGCTLQVSLVRRITDLS